MEDIIVIKIGGVASQTLSTDFLNQIHTWKNNGKKIIIIHGGGYAITELLEKAELKTSKVDGLRLTSKEHLPFIAEALLEQVGGAITATLEKEGLKPQQLTHDLKDVVQADFLNQERYGYVGQVETINTRLLEEVLENDQIPILASLGYSAKKDMLNINADYLASAVAQALQAEKLVLMTDVKGVLEDGKILNTLPISLVAEKITKGYITGGMIPKIESALQSLQAGVGQVVIGDNLLTGTIITGG